jgi:HAD superfamily hydrolase (TIGR01509 family)
MLDLIKELKSRDKKLYLLSNIAKDFREKYLKNKEISEMLSLFDGLVLSGEIGMVKPDGKIFDYLFKKYNINPKESVFVDDNILNIEGAKRAGLNICLYKLNINDLKKEIMF